MEHVSKDDAKRWALRVLRAEIKRIKESIAEASMALAELEEVLKESES